MFSLKNFNFKEHPWTTIGSIIVISLLPLLVLFGVITPEQQDATAGYITQLFGAIESHTWSAVISALFALILAFVRDGKKK